MPEFLARFQTPVLYNAGHSKARWLTELPVRAPDAPGALAHAVRVVQGDVTGLTVEPYEEVPAVLPVEVS